MLMCKSIWLASVTYKLSAGYIIDKLSAYSTQDNNQKIPIDCGKCHMKQMSHEAWRDNSLNTNANNIDID